MTAIAADERRTLSGEVEKACLAWIRQHGPIATAAPIKAGAVPTSAEMATLVQLGAA